MDNPLAKVMSDRYTELVMSESPSRGRKVRVVNANDGIKMMGCQVAIPDQLAPCKTKKVSESLSTKVKRFYNRQKKLIHSFMEAEKIVSGAGQPSSDYIATICHYNTASGDESTSNKPQDTDKRINIIITLSFVLNVALVVAKIVATALSKSMAVLGSTIDSLVDVLSSSITFFVNRSISRYDIYKNPQGKRKLEPLGVLVISCLMFVVNFQVIAESIKKIASNDEKEVIPVLSYSSIGIISGTILIKIALYFQCRKVKAISINALKQDHLNDTLSNLVAITGFIISTDIWGLGRPLWIYGDVVFAMMICGYICFSWFKTGRGVINQLIGHSADPETIQRFTWISLNHHKDIVAIDTVRAYTFGVGYLVEVDVVLPEDMPLNVAHDIGEALQRKLESLPEVERAFVHLDYECTHSPYEEHCASWNNS